MQDLYSIYGRCLVKNKVHFSIIIILNSSKFNRMLNIIFLEHVLYCYSIHRNASGLCPLRPPWSLLSGIPYENLLRRQAVSKRETRRRAVHQQQPSWRCRVVSASMSSFVAGARHLCLGKICRIPTRGLKT